MVFHMTKLKSNQNYYIDKFDNFNDLLNFNLSKFCHPNFPLVAKCFLATVCMEILCYAVNKFGLFGQKSIVTLTVIYTAGGAGETGTRDSGGCHEQAGVP